MNIYEWNIIYTMTATLVAACVVANFGAWLHKNYPAVFDFLLPLVLFVTLFVVLPVFAVKLNAANNHHPIQVENTK